MCEFKRFLTTFSRILERKRRLDTGQVIFQIIPYSVWASSTEGRLGQTWKCEGKHPLESDNLTIDAIGVTRLSIQSFTKLVGTGPTSNDCHGADRTRRHTSSSVTEDSFCKTIPVRGGFNTSEHTSEEREGQMREILLMKKALNVFASASIVVWSGKHTLG